jgi:hypothetical protein
MEISNQNPMKYKEVLEEIQAIAYGLLGYNRNTRCFDWGQSLYDIHRYLENRFKTENVKRGSKRAGESKKAVLQLKSIKALIKRPSVRPWGFLRGMSQSSRKGRLRKVIWIPGATLHRKG